MHISKKLFYTGIIAYSALILWFWDFFAGVNATGTASYLYLGKMVLDIAFIVAALIVWVGPTMFAADDDDDIGIHAEDLPVSDSLLFGTFTLNVVLNAGYHGWLYGQTTGVESAYYLIWTLAGIFAAIFCGLVWQHTVKSHKRQAAKLAKQQSGKLKSA